MRGQIVSKTETYGFIHCEKGVPHWFSRKMVSKDTSYDSLTIGDAVTFEPVAGPKGMRASNVALRAVKYGWTTGPFVILKNEAIPSRDYEFYIAPKYAGERYVSQWIQFGVPFDGSASEALNRLTERAKATGANAIDSLKLVKCEHPADGIVTKYSCWTGRAVFYHSSVEVESDEAAAALVDQHNAELDIVSPKMLALVDELKAEENGFTIAAPFVPGESFTTLHLGQSLKEDKRLLCGVTIMSGWHRDSTTGKRELMSAAHAAGANCILDLEQVEDTRSSGNYMYTMRSWQATIGVWGRRRQISDPVEVEKTTQSTMEHCNAVEDRLKKSQADFESSRSLEYGRYAFGSCVPAIIVLVIIFAVFF